MLWFCVFFLRCTLGFIKWFPCMSPAYLLSSFFFYSHIFYCKKNKRRIMWVKHRHEREMLERKGDDNCLTLFTSEKAKGRSERNWEKKRTLRWVFNWNTIKKKEEIKKKHSARKRKVRKWCLLVRENEKSTEKHLNWVWTLWGISSNPPLKSKSTADRLHVKGSELAMWFFCY